MCWPRLLAALLAVLGTAVPLAACGGGGELRWKHYSSSGNLQWQVDGVYTYKGGAPEYDDEW